MHQYLVDTEFAVKNLLALVVDEEARLRASVGELASAEAQQRTHAWDFESSDLNDDFSTAYVMAAYARMAEAGSEADSLRSEVYTLQALVGAHQTATQAIAGAVLQVSKQGIALVYGDIDKSPKGRKIGSLPLRDIIWQARNQAMHYEEEILRKPVTKLFSILEDEQGSQFSIMKHPRQSRAKQVLELLRWETYESYQHDMSAILR